MAGKYLWSALFVMLQISFVLCRSTGTPDELDKEISIAPTEDGIRAEALKETGAPGELTKDDVHIQKGTTYYQRTDVDSTAVTIVLVLYFVFLISSFILGCILYYRSKARAVRRGHIVDSSTGVQSFGIKPPNSAM